MVEEETPSLTFEMSRIFVKLFLVTEFCFPGNERALSWIFSENAKMKRNKGAPFERSQMSLSCWLEIGRALYRPGNKRKSNLGDFITICTSKLMTGNSASNEIGI